MQYRTLGGRTGAVVSTYAPGTMTFGAEATEENSRAILDDYFAAGGNFIDTADVYSAGVSEEVIDPPVSLQPCTACWSGKSNLKLFRQRSTPKSACCPGHLWAVAGYRASTSGTRLRREPRGWGRTPNVAWRPGRAYPYGPMAQEQRNCKIEGGR